MIGGINLKGGTDTTDATATSNDLLLGKTAYANNQKLNGTIANNGALRYTPSTNSQNIPAGYTSGGVIEAVTNSIDNNIIANNIKKGVNILDVAGTYTSDATATSNDIFTEKTAYINGVKVIGTMPNMGSKTFTPNNTTQTSGAGYYNEVVVNPQPRN